MNQPTEPYLGAFPQLLSPLQVGPIELRNRVVMAPHSTHYADRTESERLTAYYVERAQADVGLIVHEPVIVHQSSLSRVGKIWGYDEENVQAYRRTTDAVHGHGAHIVCQLIHNGRQVDGHESEMPAWFPTEVARGGTIEVTHAMTKAEIAEVVEGFARSAEICARGGFDGVEVHAAHGYLLQGFLSPATNWREDEYGGSVEARGRIVIDIVRAIREAVPEPFVVGVRLTGDEVQPGGLDEADCVEIARILAEHVDYISVVSGSLPSYDRIVPDMSFPRGLNVVHAAAIREAVEPVPVLVTGRIAEPGQAEQILVEGQADLIGLARSLIADPQWLSKAAAGAVEDIRPCVYANDCRDSIGGRRSLVCMVNPSAGRELELVERPSAGRRVIVVGGGIAGMEAALAAADQGDDVVLFERSEILGGQLRLARVLPARAELRRLEEYLVGRVQRSAIELRLGVSPDADVLRELGPDLVVVATGAEPVREVTDTGTLVAIDVLAGAEVPSRAVVVEDRSGANSWTLLATVELLAERGHDVTLVTPAFALGTGIEAASIPPLLRRLKERSVRIELMSAVVLHDARGAHVRRNDTGEVSILDGATVVGEFGRRSAGATGPWSEVDVEVRVIGDVMAPRRIATAILEGQRAVSRTAGN